MVGVILYLEERIMLARINESLGEEVIGERRDTIIDDVLEISSLPLVREMWQLLEKRRVFLLYSVRLKNIMEVHSVMNDENCSRRDVDLCRCHMLGMVDYYMNFYRWRWRCVWSNDPCEGGRIERIG